MSDATIGIDVSKDRLDVRRLPDGAEAAFNNDKAGLKALVTWLGTGVQRVVFEPTGRYHLALERRQVVHLGPVRRTRESRRSGAAATRGAVDPVVRLQLGARQGFHVHDAACPARARPGDPERRGNQGPGGDGLEIRCHDVGYSDYRV